MRLKCIRCGVCCVSAICSLGEASAKTGLCDQLVIHEKGHASCRQAIEHPDMFKLFGKGCPIRSVCDIDAFKYIKAQAEARAGRSLNGLGGDDARSRTVGVCR